MVRAARRLRLLGVTVAALLALLAACSTRPGNARAISRPR